MMIIATKQRIGEPVPDLLGRHNLMKVQLEDVHKIDIDQLEEVVPSMEHGAYNAMLVTIINKILKKIK